MNNENHAKRGRPALPADKLKGLRLHIRIAAPELAAWRGAAFAAGVPLSAWVRQQCNAESERASTARVFVPGVR